VEARQLQGFFPIPVNKTYLIVHERLEFLALVEDSLQLHLLSFGFGFDRSANSSVPKPGSRCTFFYISSYEIKSLLLKNYWTPTCAFPVECGQAVE